MALRSLARLWSAGGDAGLPAAVAAVLGVAPEEVEERLRAGLNEEAPEGTERAEGS